MTPLIAFFTNWRMALQRFWIASVLSFLGDKSASLKRGAILRRLSDGKGIGQLLLTVFFGFLIIACGLLVERLFLRLTDGLRKQILNTVALGKLQRLGRFFSRLLLDALGIGVYILTTFILFIIIFRQEEAGYWIVADFLIVSYYFLVIRFAAKMIMSPASAPLRPLPPARQGCEVSLSLDNSNYAGCRHFGNPRSHTSEHRPQRSPF